MIWAEVMSRTQIDRGRESDRQMKEEYFAGGNSKEPVRKRLIENLISFVMSIFRK